jgi:hypothetical protein
MLESMEAVELRDGSRDFDFLFGEWRVRHRRLRYPLQRSSEWYEFESTCVAQPVWGGKANFDQFTGESPAGRFEGATFRLYDPATRRWSLYWATPSAGLVTVPNVGAFNEGGTGEFFSNEIFEGRPIVCRYRWIANFEQGCKWEQAFSDDGGATWETNWIMEFKR